MTEKEELETLRAENARLNRENTGLRTQIFFLNEERKNTTDKELRRRVTANGVGQQFCPRCFSCVYEPPNIPGYWRILQHSPKQVPEYCSVCGQHLEAPTASSATPQTYEEDPLKNYIKENKNNGNRYYRR